MRLDTRRTRYPAGALLGVLAAFAMTTVSPWSGDARAYDPVPTPTATASPAPTPTPIPTPTPTPTLAPGLLPRPNGAANPPNPPRSFEVVRGVTVVSQNQVLQTPVRYYIFPASTSARSAPRADRWENGRWVPVYRVGDVMRLVATVPARRTYDIVLQRNGRSTSFGIATSDGIGKMSLPGLRVDGPGVYDIVLVDTRSGTRLFLKISVGA